MGRSILDFCGDLASGHFQSFYSFRSSIEHISEDLWYSDALHDLYSLVENISGRRLVEKSDTTVVKTDSGNLLGFLQEEYTQDRIQHEVQNICSLQQLSEDNGAHFLYCQIPNKTIYDTAPPNAENYSRQNYDRILEAVEASGCPVLDLKTALKEYGIPDSDLFFLTDHHWTPKTGFAVVSIICDQLQRRYGFEYDPALTDLQNYHVEQYKNWFLGSYGKKIGTYFTWHGADDFDLILPAFPTDFTEFVPSDNRSRTGTFENSLLHMEKMKRDLYKTNTYATYGGGDYRLQILYNHLHPNASKTLVIRNSFSCVVTPFLALHTGELHIIDDREGDYPSPELIPIATYIEENKPDYVLLIKDT